LTSILTSTRIPSLRIVEQQQDLRTKSAARVRETGIQAFLYLGAFAFSHVFVFVCPNVEVAGGVNPFWTLFLQNTLYPFQGFFNIFVFVRPRIIALRKRDSTMSYVRAAVLATFYNEDDTSRTTNRQQHAQDSAPFPFSRSLQSHQLATSEKDVTNGENTNENTTSSPDVEESVQQVNVNT